MHSEKMASPIRKRSVILSGHKTSLSVEDEFWTALKAIAGSRIMTVTNLVSEIRGTREGGNLSSAVRIYVLAYYKDQCPAQLSEEPAVLPSAGPGQALASQISAADGARDRSGGI